MKTRRPRAFIPLACCLAVALLWNVSPARGATGLLVGSASPEIGSRSSDGTGYTVDLTADGTLDWACWGYQQATSVDRKSTGDSKISDFILVGPTNLSASPNNTVRIYQNNPCGMSVTWSDGNNEPAPWAGLSASDVRVETEKGGFQFTVPADTTTRRLKVYVGLFRGAGKLEAHLSDASAPDFVDVSLVEPVGYKADEMHLYTLLYKAGSAGQTLTVTWTLERCPINSIGEVSLMAATLALDDDLTVYPPTFSPGSGTYTNSQTLSLASGTSGATILYTLDGADPAASGLTYTGPITATTNLNLRAIATKAGMNDSPVSVGAYTMAVAAPVFSAPAGTNATPPTVTISTATTGATICYRTDGIDPTPTSGTVYSTPITVTSGTLKAIAFKTGMANSSVAQALYVVGAGGGGALAGSLSAPLEGPDLNIDLTAEGASDWAYWGRSGTGFDHKATGNNQISDLATLNSPVKMRRQTLPITASWTDGTPTAALDPGASGSDRCVAIREFSSVGNGLKFTVPADTHKRRLKVYVAARGAAGTLAAHLSDGSAPDYVDNAFSESTYPLLGSDVVGAYTLDYRAASPGQSLTVTLTMTSAEGLGDIGIKAATLQFPDGGAVQAPVCEPRGGTYANGQLVTLSCRTAGAIIYYTLDGSEPTADSTRYTAPVGISSSTVTLKAVAILAGLANSSLITETYTILGSGTTGTLTASANGPLTGTVDLTAEGTLDWVCWGRTSATSFDHKASGGGLISNFTKLGPGSVFRNNPCDLSAVWSDGTPPNDVVTANVNDVRIETVGSGFQFTAPADTKPRTLTVYVGLWKGAGKFTAHLSDISASDFVDTSLRDDLGPAKEVMYSYTVNYQAARPGQQLVVSWILNSTPGGGDASLMAATLQAPPTLELQQPAYAPGVGFQFSLPTQPGRTYTIEYTDDLTNGTWSTLEVFAGDGAVHQVIDATVSPTQARFYRATAN